eukprot:759164-Hanusia_phi.AAC.4
MTTHYAIPRFHASGTGRDMYLDPCSAQVFINASYTKLHFTSASTQSTIDDASLRRAHRRTIRFSCCYEISARPSRFVRRYKDFDNNKHITLHWWSRLPAYKRADEMRLFVMVEQGRRIQVKMAQGASNGKEVVTSTTSDGLL